MRESPPAEPPKKAKLWLGLTVGWLAQLGLKTIVPLLVLVGFSFLSRQSENPGRWLEAPFDSSHPLWYALQLSIGLSSFCAGALGGFLSGGRYRALAFGLALLSLLTTFFEQFPLHASTVTLLIWTFGPCVGVVAGVAFSRFGQRWRVHRQ
ncbi:hypothetical protein [Massilia sp. DWR3-1-1]|uniref:hypothetical protein n=1 Tax=Massilia sp. DWR3-1-1 TaxID=2804559 RepID=UPI003CF242E4